MAGYLDIPDALNGYQSSMKIVGHEDNFKFKKNDYVLISVTTIEAKKAIYHKLQGKTKFYTFISDRATIGHYNTFGSGTIICPGVTITNNVKIGDCVSVNVGTTIGHDVVVGDYSTLMASIDIGGECKLGNEVFVGTKATILPRINVGENALIGAGRGVIKDVMQGVTVFGNPAKKI